MNAHPQISNEAAAYLAETPLSVRRSLLDAMAIYQNEDAVMRDKAIDAIAEGRAAYWTTANYSNAVAFDLPYSLNSGVAIGRAVDAAYEKHLKFKAGALDTIVPLNRKATNALALAYLQAGSFRDDDELEMRAKRDTRRQTKREPLTYANYKAGVL